MVTYARRSTRNATYLVRLVTSRWFLFCDRLTSPGFYSRLQLAQRFDFTSTSRLGLLVQYSHLNTVSTTICLAPAVMTSVVNDWRCDVTSHRVRPLCLSDITGCLSGTYSPVGIHSTPLRVRFSRLLCY